MFTTKRDKVRRACERLGVHASTSEVLAFLVSDGVVADPRTERSYVSRVVNAWRRERGVGDTGEQARLSPAMLAELDGEPVVETTLEAVVETTLEQPVIETTPVRFPRSWPLLLIGLAGSIAVWSGWVSIGRLTGFGVVQPLPGIADGVTLNTAVLLPVGIEAYGGYALRVWLSAAALSDKTIAFAKWSSLVSLTIGAGAQVASHLLTAAGVTAAPWPVTTLIACVPVALVGLAAGLARLVANDRGATPGPGSRDPE